MNPKMPGSTPQDELFRNRLDNMVDQRYGLLRLTKLIDWSLLIIQTQDARLVAGFLPKMAASVPAYLLRFQMLDAHGVAV